MTERTRGGDGQDARRQRINMIQAVVGLACMGGGGLLIFGWGAALLLLGVMLFATAIFGSKQR